MKERMVKRDQRETGREGESRKKEGGEEATAGKERGRKI